MTPHDGGFRAFWSVSAVAGRRSSVSSSSVTVSTITCSGKGDCWAFIGTFADSDSCCVSSLFGLGQRKE